MSWFKRSRVVTPNILQMEAVECGAASLAIILGYFGRYVSLAELRETCGVSRDGSKASNIMKAAEQYGLNGYGCSVTVEELKEKRFPVIIFWELNHFVVVEGFDKNEVYINDPSMGYRTLTMDEFKKGFTGIALVLSPTDAFKKGGVKPSFLPALLRRLKGKLTTLIFLLGIGILLVVPNLVLPILSKLFVDDFLVLHLNTWLWPLLIGLLLATLAQGVLTWMKNYFLLKFRMQLSLSTSSQFFWHVLHLPIRFYSQRSPGDIAQRYGLCDQSAQIITVILLSILLSLFSALLFLILMAFYSIPLTIFGVVIALINVLILYFFKQSQINFGKRLSRDTGKLYANAINGLSLIETYKASGLESLFFGRVMGLITKVINSYQQTARTRLKLLSISILLPTVNTIMVLGVGGYLIMNGSFSIGSLVAFQTLLLGFMLPFTHLVQVTNQLQQMSGNMMRLDDVLNYPKPPQSSQPQTSTSKFKLVGKVEIKELTFGYDKLIPPLINNLNLSVEPGKLIAILSASGGGSSTLLRILAGLEEPWSGDVLFDGIRREQLSSITLAKSISYVSDSMQIFVGSVRDNITLWDNTLTNEEVTAAAKTACIHETILDREGAYDAAMEENGRNFSGGEKQRIELARALVNKPAVLLLDKALSALDAPVEQSIMHNLRKQGCTCLFTTNRINNLCLADRILVLDQGHIAWHGEYDELLIQGGQYADLLNNK